ncbi:uncharacterized protein [Temnothorax longispinosus]|uniref:uncharacterized protein isoform X2 n=1 Tax=Temnothorax longispinosus TaxID=300112 RepID=UPI003A99E954
MKRTYKSIKDHNNKSGNDKRSWKYFELMDNLLGKKPSMRPLSTISSTGQVSLKSDNDETSTSSLSTFSETSGNESSDVNIKVSRKRKTSDIAQAIIESRKIAEEEKAKRHRERMEVKDKLIGKLDEILKKL